MRPHIPDTDSANKVLASEGTAVLVKEEVCHLEELHGEGEIPHTQLHRCGVWRMDIQPRSRGKWTTKLSSSLQHEIQHLDPHHPLRDGEMGISWNGGQRDNNIHVWRL